LDDIKVVDIYGKIGYTYIESRDDGARLLDVSRIGFLVK
jgi:hypothetical protein